MQCEEKRAPGRGNSMCKCSDTKNTKGWCGWRVVVEGVVTSDVVGGWRWRYILQASVRWKAFHSNYNRKPLSGTQQRSDQKFYILKDSPGCGLENELWGGSQKLRLRGPLG